MDMRQARWACIGILLVATAAACSGSAAPSVAPTVAPATELSPAPTETAAPSVAETAAAIESPVPSASREPLPSFDQAELDAYLTSSITLIDLADDDLVVDVWYVDPSTDEAIDLGSYALEATDQMTNQVPPGTYRLEFHQPAGSKTGSTCTIDVSGADGYVFAAVPGAVAVTRTGTNPRDVGDLFVTTSSLCGNGG